MSEVSLSEKEQVLDFNRYGVICIILLIVGCLGGITVWAGAIESVFGLSLVVIPTMTTLSLLLAVARMKWILNLAYLSICIDLLLLIYYWTVA